MCPHIRRYSFTKYCPETIAGTFFFGKQEAYTRGSFRIHRESLSLTLSLSFSRVLPPRVIVSSRSTVKRARFYLHGTRGPMKLSYAPRSRGRGPTVPNHCHIREGKSIFDGGRCTRAYIRFLFPRNSCGRSDGCVYATNFQKPTNLRGRTEKKIHARARTYTEKKNFEKTCTAISK